MTKRRILDLIKYKKITIQKFFELTGIKRGFLDSDKLNQSVSDRHLAMIFAAFPDINAEWLITGKGEMLRNGASKDTHEDNPLHIDIEAVKMLIAEKDRTIANLQEQLDKKDQQIEKLLHIIENK